MTSQRPATTSTTFEPLGGKGRSNPNPSPAALTLTLAPVVQP